MKKHFTKSLTVIFAVIGVYFVAFKVLMKLRMGEMSSYECYAEYGPRWSSLDWTAEAMRTCFAPLIWNEKRICEKDEWNWHVGTPEPDWVKEYYRDKP